MKSIIFAGLLLGAAHGAHAAPYLNVETNQGYSGGELGATVTDVHYGVEGGDEVFSWYIQGGPSYTAVQGEDGEAQLSGKLGGSAALGTDLSIYGEVSAASTSDDPSVGLKAGLKWGF